jgi:hypothetical protein
MVRLKLCQLAVKIILHRRLGLARNDNNPAISGDLDASDVHTGGERGPNRPGHVTLPECSRSARHD